MNFIIGFIIVLIIFIIVAKVISDSEDSKREAQYKSQGLVHIETFTPKYLGGFSDVGACEICIFELFKDKCVIKLSGGSGSNIFNKTKTIRVEHILSLKVETENQIREKVSLGKLACFGILAFGMNGKQKTLSNNYVVMKARYNDEEVNLVFQIDNYTAFISTINQTRYNK